LHQALVLIKESTPVQWVLIREERISYGLYYLWLAGCVYWVYQLSIVEATPRPDWMYIIEDTREALTILFVGSFGLFYVVGIVLFICKFIYNLFTEGIESLFSRQWHSVAKSFCYILILGFSFQYIPNIKVAGLTAYDQISQLVSTSERHEEVAAKHFNSLKELLNRTDRLTE
jgi:hypothetical protein